MVFEPSVLIIFICLGLAVALVTMSLFLIIRQVNSRIARTLIPIIYCITIFPLITILNPQPDNVLYFLSSVGGFALSGMLILIPFPLFERKIPSNLHKYVVFFGALVATVFMYNLTYGQPSGFISSIGILSPLIIIAFTALVFAGITVIIKVFIKPSEDQTPELVQPSHNQNKNKILKIALLLLIICIIPVLLAYGPGWYSEYKYINNLHTVLIPVNENYTQNQIIIHLTENDFKTFPQLAAVIRDNKQNNMYVTPDGTKIYNVHLTEPEAQQFQALYCPSSIRITGTGGFFEYNGKYFRYTDPLFVMPSGREM